MGMNCCWGDCKSDSRRLKSDRVILMPFLKPKTELKRVERC